MGMKLGLSSLLFKLKDTPRSSCSFSSPSTSSSSWPWSSCKNPKTSSFRDADVGTIYKTVNSVFFYSAESGFTHSSEEQESFSTVSEDSADESLEKVVRGLSSDRLFFEPGDTNSILEEAKSGEFPFKESVVLTKESEDPYRDFRVSMEEMVVANGIRDWGMLEDLLAWYLRVNGKKTHGFIVGAFVDLLHGLASPTPPPPPPTSSSSSSISFDHTEEKDQEGEEEGSGSS